MQSYFASLLYSVNENVHVHTSKPIGKFVRTKRYYVTQFLSHVNVR